MLHNKHDIVIKELHSIQPRFGNKLLLYETDEAAKLSHFLDVCLCQFNKGESWLKTAERSVIINRLTNCS